MMLEEKLCFWSWEEDVIPCKFYLDHLNDWSKKLNISKLVEDLKNYTFKLCVLKMKNEIFKKRVY